MRHVRPTARQRGARAGAAVLAVVWVVSHSGDARGSFFPHHGRGSAHAHIGATSGADGITPRSHRRSHRDHPPYIRSPIVGKVRPRAFVSATFHVLLLVRLGVAWPAGCRVEAREPTEDTCCLSRNDLAAEQKTTGAGTWSRRTACLRARRQCPHRHKPPLNQSPFLSRRPASAPRRLLRRRVVSSVPFRLPVQARRVSFNRPSPTKR